MTDVVLPRIIVIGLLVIAVGCIVASVVEPMATWPSFEVNSVVSGLLGYIAGNILTPKKPDVTK